MSAKTHPAYDANLCCPPLIYLVVLVSIGFATPASAQTAPDARWENATWPGMTPAGTPQTQSQSGEDWFYSVDRLQTPPGSDDVFVAAGYSTFSEATSCADDDRRWHAFTAHVDGAGDTEAFTFVRPYDPAGGGTVGTQIGIEGPVLRVIGTSDGGYLAVGNTSSRPDLRYNPTAADPDGLALGCFVDGEDGNSDPVFGPVSRIGFAAKFGADGVQDWAYTYGMMDDPDDYFRGAPNGFQAYHEGFTGVVERADGGFRMVGSAANPADGFGADNAFIGRAVVVDIDANGLVVGRRSYGTAGVGSYFSGVARDGSTYVAAGVVDVNGYSDVLAVRLGAAPAPPASVSVNVTNTAASGVQNAGFDVAYSGTGQVFVAAALDCVEGVRGQCNRGGAGGQGEGRVFVLDPVTLVTQTSTSLDTVKAYDLFIRLHQLTDGGVAVVSSKQPGGPLPCPAGANCGDAETNNTDAYVARLSASGAMVWETTYAAQTNKTHFEAGYNKQQECLYDVTEASDGSLVISGNNSSNLDDGYLVRFSHTDLPSAPGLHVRNQHLVYPTVPASSSGPGGQTLQFSDDVTVGANSWLTARSGTRFELAPWSYVEVDGALNAEDAVFTASAPGQGWSGIRFDPGSGGSLTAGTVIEKVAGWGTSALYIRDASPLLSDLFVNNPVQPSAVSGITVTGANTYPGAANATMKRVVVADMTSRGIVLHDRATARIVRSDITDSSSDGLEAGYRTNVFLYPDHDANPNLGTVLSANGGNGIDATSDADLTLGYYYYSYTGGPPNAGFNSSVGNGSDGVRARGGARVAAGQLVNFNQAKNRFFSNTSQDARASGSGSLLYARCDWWNDTTPPFRTTETSGGIVYDDYWLLQDPYVNPNAACTNAPPSKSSAQLTAASSRVSEGPRDWLIDGVEAADASAALAQFERIVAEAPESSYATAAVAEIGFVAAHPRAYPAQAPEAVAVLERLAASPEPGLRWEATRGLIGTRLAGGDETGALALADDLVAQAGEDPERVRSVQVERAYLLAALGRDREAGEALVTAERAGGDPVAVRDVEAAREALGLAVAEASPSAALAKTAIDETAASEMRLLPPAPNPVAGLVRLGLDLPSETHARVSVYDALGRVVAVLHDGSLSEGAHRWRLNAGAYPSGVYLVRASTERRAEVVHFTVAR